MILTIAFHRTCSVRGAHPAGREQDEEKGQQREASVTDHVRPQVVTTTRKLFQFNTSTNNPDIVHRKSKKKSLTRCLTETVERERESLGLFQQLRRRVEWRASSAWMFGKRRNRHKDFVGVERERKPRALPAAKEKSGMACFQCMDVREETQLAQRLRRRERSIQRRQTETIKEKERTTEQRTSVKGRAFLSSSVSDRHSDERSCRAERTTGTRTSVPVDQERSIQRRQTETIKEKERTTEQRTSVKGRAFLSSSVSDRHSDERSCRAERTTGTRTSVPVDHDKTSDNNQMKTNGKRQQTDDDERP
ncbi:uncharacterized protein HKW66_Vig0044470 [Vigna angularis]|uniref:Uncharacterized protein n=1 Tax=Phaseolus angularis TaxID=3914 RepID=A0A8T0L117_PHAAN|nr:uncharacterized protein HKW66_Vig0044470 [Vigna angularis]